MSKRAVEWAKAFEAGGGIWMPRSHWRALRVVAQFYHEALGCAFTKLEGLADEAGMSARHMRRTIAELDEMGVVRRNFAQRSRDKSDTSNEYELPGYRLVQADAAMRSRIFSVARERVVEQTQLQLDGREDDLTPWMLFLVRMRRKNAKFMRRDVEGGCPVVPFPGSDEGFGPAAGAVDGARECPRGEDALSGDPRTPCPPVDLTNDFNEEIEPPYAPLGDGGRGGTVEKQPQRQRLPDQGGGSGNVVVFPKRQRQARSASGVREHLRAALYDSVRSTLDGEDVALWDEATRVMRACGVSPESSGRKVRRAVLEALRLQSDKGPAASIHAYGCLMISRWEEYERLGVMRFAPLGFTRFITEGEWLRPNGWRLDRELVDRARRGGL